MKKLLFPVIILIAVVSAGCSKQTDSYNASFTASQFANSNNEVSVNTLFKSYSWFWLGEDFFKSSDTEMNDLKAVANFEKALASAAIHWSDLEQYFEDGDFMEYTLTRTTNGSNVVLMKVKFTADGDEVIYNMYDEK